MPPLRTSLDSPEFAREVSRPEGRSPTPRHSHGAPAQLAARWWTATRLPTEQKGPLSWEPEGRGAGRQIRSQELPEGGEIRRERSSIFSFVAQVCTSWRAFVFLLIHTNCFHLRKDSAQLLMTGLVRAGNSALKAWTPSSKMLQEGRIRRSRVASCMGRCQKSPEPGYRSLHQGSAADLGAHVRAALMSPIFSPPP